MALKYTFARQVKPTRPAGDKHSDGGDEARKLLAEGIAPSQAKRDDRHAKTAAAGCTFQGIARQWLHNTQAERADSTQQKNTSWLEKNIFPDIGAMQIEPRDVLAALRKVEARGAIESAHKIKQLCGKVFRFSDASGPTQRDVTADLRDALAAVPGTHYASITEPTQACGLCAPSSTTAAIPTPWRRSSWRRCCLRALGNCAPLNGPKSIWTMHCGAFPPSR